MRKIENKPSEIVVSSSRQAIFCVLGKCFRKRAYFTKRGADTHGQYTRPEGFYSAVESVGRILQRAVIRDFIKIWNAASDKKSDWQAACGK